MKICSHSTDYQSTPEKSNQSEEEIHLDQCHVGLKNAQNSLDFLVLLLSFPTAQYRERFTSNKKRPIDIQCSRQNTQSSLGENEGNAARVVHAERHANEGGHGTEGVGADDRAVDETTEKEAADEETREPVVQMRNAVEDCLQIQGDRREFFTKKKKVTSMPSTSI